MSKMFQVFLLLLFLSLGKSFGQTKSIARIWNEALLNAVRNDYARPTIHARNLFHSSVLMFDSWALFEQGVAPYFIGTNNLGANEGLPKMLEQSEYSDLAVKETMSYALYRLIKHRFKNAPKYNIIEQNVNNLMDSLGYDNTYTSTQETTPAAIGNYLAQEIINFGLSDGSNEGNNYKNQFYTNSNGLLFPDVSGNAEATDFNLWQPLTLDIFIDQSGNVTPNNTPKFLTPEWGHVIPFAMTNDEITEYSKYGTDLKVYNDPGSPVFMTDSATDFYKWGFALVLSWSSHLDSLDQTLIDISPVAMGGIQGLPSSPADYSNFYKFEEGGDKSSGYQKNPITGLPYTTQLVSRADYARVLAEFWADGPDSETPPGHWFTILNYVNDNPLFEKRWKGDGAIISDIEWDVKAYLTLGGAMHDAAISAWSVKGYYDYIRPISAVRLMAEYGQCSNSSLPNYNLNGLPLIGGLIELVDDSDPLSGISNKNSGEIKVFSWRGPDYINDESTDIAGVGWILAKDWWPYQRPTFVTPPFAGYVSGHSVFSRAAAEVLTLMTGDEYFPGGLGEFIAKKNEFLVFEKGPSTDIKLQWATYRDASDQTSLSRIYGGIHPPIDDIPGRIIGQKVGVKAFDYIDRLIEPTSLSNSDLWNNLIIYPNPSSSSELIKIKASISIQSIKIYDATGRQIRRYDDVFSTSCQINEKKKKGIYIVQLSSKQGSYSKVISVL